MSKPEVKKTDAKDPKKAGKDVNEHTNTARTPSREETLGKQGTAPNPKTP